MVGPPGTVGAPAVCRGARPVRALAPRAPGDHGQDPLGSGPGLVERALLLGRGAGWLRLAPGGVAHCVGADVDVFHERPPVVSSVWAGLVGRRASAEPSAAGSRWRAWRAGAAVEHGAGEEPEQPAE